MPIDNFRFVETNRSSRSSSIAVTRELSLCDPVTEIACYSYATLHRMSLGINRVMRLPDKSPILFYTLRVGHEINPVFDYLARRPLTRLKISEA